MSTVYPESFAVFEAKSHTFMQAGKKKKKIKVSQTQFTKDQILGTVCKAEANPNHNPSSNPRGLGAGSHCAGCN